MIAYTSVNRFLRKNKILSPKLFSQNYSKGIIIIEDFGNTTIYKLLLKEKNRFKIYKELVNTLIKKNRINYKVVDFKNEIVIPSDELNIKDAMSIINDPKVRSDMVRQGINYAKLFVTYKQKNETGETI